MTRILWISDAHLDHLSSMVADAWFDLLEESRADMLLLGGDTANARLFSPILERIKQNFRGRIALVAGNHDYYGTSIAAFRKKLKWLERSGISIFEPGCRNTPLPIADGVYLCGSGGWGDARAGFADASGMALNDENLINELKKGPLTAKFRLLDLGEK